MATTAPPASPPATPRAASESARSDGTNAPAAAAETGAAGNGPALSASTSQPMKLLKAWLHGIKISHVGHTRAAVVYERRAKVLGVITTLISAIIATAIFSSAAASTNATLLVVAGILSAAAVVVSALATFLNYGQLAANHRLASIAYGGLRRRIELITVFEDPSDLGKKMPEIAEAWLKLEEASPDLPAGIFDYARKWVAKRAAAGERDDIGS